MHSYIISIAITLTVEVAAVLQMHMIVNKYQGEVKAYLWNRWIVSRLYIRRCNLCSRETIIPCC